MASNDFVISTNLIVFGMSTFTGGQTFDGQMIVDLNSAEALLVRKDGDGGDVFVVDTDDNQVFLFAREIIDHDADEAFLVRQQGDTGDVFIVNTNTPSATMAQANSFISLGPNPAASGDIRFGNTRFIAWRNMNNNGDVQALSVDEDDFLNIGSAAALRSRILSPRLDMLSGADLLWPAEDGDIGASSANRPANVHVKSTVVIGDDETAGYGITIGDNHQGHSPLWIVGSFTSDGAQGFSAASAWSMILTGFAGDTVLAGLHVANQITTQGNTDVIANVSQLFLAEPQIIVGTGDTITNAQTVLIGGAPTEGTSNYALRVQSGDVLFADLQFSVGEASIGDIFQVEFGGNFGSGGSSTFATNFRLSAGLVGAAGDTASLTNVRFEGGVATQTATESIGEITQLRVAAPTITDNLTGGGLITTAQSLLIPNAPTAGVNNYALRVITGDVLLGGNLAVLGAGPHSIAGTPSGIIGLIISETFTSDGSGTLASGVFITQTLVGASGDTTSLTGVTFISAITTQTETESIANISQVEINEPFISDNLTGDITNAQTLLIVNAPTEGLSNFAIRVITGSVFFGGAQAIFGDGTAALPGIVFESDLDTGFYLDAGNDSLLISVNANSIIRFDRASSIPRINLSSDCQLTWLSGAAEGGGVQFVLGREAADAGGASVGDLFLANTHLSIYQDRTSTTIYHRTSFRFSDETLSNVSGATVSTTSLIPNGALVLGVTTEVTVALGTGNGTTGYEVGDGSDSDRWGNITGTSTATFSDDADFSTSFLNARFTAGGDVTLTAVGGDFDGTGDILVVVHWVEVGARK